MKSLSRRQKLAAAALGSLLLMGYAFLPYWCGYHGYLGRERPGWYLLAGWWTGLYVCGCEDGGREKPRLPFVRNSLVPVKASDAGQPAD